MKHTAWMDFCCELEVDNDRLRARVEELEAENERLKAEGKDD